MTLNPKGFVDDVRLISLAKYIWFAQSRNQFHDAASKNLDCQRSEQQSHDPRGHIQRSRAHAPPDTDGDAQRDPREEGEDRGVAQFALGGPDCGHLGL